MTDLVKKMKIYWKYVFGIVVIISFLMVMISLISPKEILPELEEFNNDRTIKVDVQLGDNYINHLYLMANSGLNDQVYYNENLTTISENHRITLQSYIKEMTYGGDYNYGLYFYLIPANYNFDSVGIWETYFEDLEDYLTSDTETFVDKYNLNGKINLNESQKENIDLQIVKELKNAYIDSFKVYEEEVWPGLCKILTQRANDLNEELSKHSIVKAWETTTGYIYPFKHYKVSLVYGNSTGVMANNIGGNENLMVFNAFHGKQDMVDMMSHELGVRILLPHVIDCYNDYLEEYGVYEEQGFKAGELLYLSFEEFVAYFNSKIMSRETYDLSLYFTEDDHVLSRVIIPAREKEIEAAKYLYKRVMDYYMASRLGEIPILLADGVYLHQENYKMHFTLNNGLDVYALSGRGLIFRNDDKLSLVARGVSEPQLSPDGKNIAYLDDYHFESISNLIVYDSESETFDKKTEFDYNQSDTVKRVVWLEDDSFLLIIGYAYGASTRGGSIYELNSEGILTLVKKPEDGEFYVEMRIEDDKLIADKIIWDDDFENFTTHTELIELGGRDNE